MLITSSGEFGFRRGGIRGKQDHLTPHIETLRGYLGAEEVMEVNAGYQEFGDVRHRSRSRQRTARRRGQPSASSDGSIPRPTMPRHADRGTFGGRGRRAVRTEPPAIGLGHEIPQPPFLVEPHMNVSDLRLFLVRLIR